MKGRLFVIKGSVCVSISALKHPLLVPGDVARKGRRVLKRATRPNITSALHSSPRNLALLP